MRALAALLICLNTLAAPLPDCRQVAQSLNAKLQGQLNTTELAQSLSQLNQTGQLPAQFVTKKQARQAGWQPGRPLWRSPELQGKSLGGDHFGNREKRLPRGNWREADLDYRGGKRNAKRLVFEPSRDGRRYVTIDHYEQFTEISPCR
ncbi:ribonuclease domain-containing protein [Chitinimonas sp. JJ19]|uniref:ribonuclease domain-containing protein n=1 Tax=Chitinimonas sp. JJ19 TaxID=3109352 RepID=UPI002FFE1D13